MSNGRRERKRVGGGVRNEYREKQQERRDGEERWSESEREKRQSVGPERKIKTQQKRKYLGQKEYVALLTGLQPPSDRTDGSTQMLSATLKTIAPYAATFAAGVLAARFFARK